MTKQIADDLTEARLELGDAGRLVRRGANGLVDLTEGDFLRAGELRRPAGGADRPCLRLDQLLLARAREAKVHELRGRAKARADLLQRDAWFEGTRAVRLEDQPTGPSLQRGRGFGGEGASGYLERAVFRQQLRELARQDPEANRERGDLHAGLARFAQYETQANRGRGVWRELPRARAPRREWVDDDAAADRCRGGRGAQNESVAGAEYNGLVEDDAREFAFAGSENAVGGNDAGADVGGADVESHGGPRAERLGCIVEQDDLGAKGVRGVPCAVRDEEAAPLHVGDLDPRQGDGGAMPRLRDLHLAAVRLQAADADRAIGGKHANAGLPR